MRQPQAILRSCAARRGEDGQVTLFVLGLAVAAFALAGLVVDGGRELAAEQHAYALAEAAARAGAGALSTGGLHQGTLVVDPARAVAAADALLVAGGHPGRVSVAGDSVTVRVSWSAPTDLLCLVGIDTFRVRAAATATDANGIGPG